MNPLGIIVDIGCVNIVKNKYQQKFFLHIYDLYFAQHWYWLLLHLYTIYNLSIEDIMLKMRKLVRSQIWLGGGNIAEERPDKTTHQHPILWLRSVATLGTCRRFYFTCIWSRFYKLLDNFSAAVYIYLSQNALGNVNTVAVFTGEHVP